MHKSLESVLKEKGADIVRFVDLAALPEAQRLGYPSAVLFCMALSKPYLAERYADAPLVEETDEYLLKEAAVEALADWLAEYLKEQGYRAYAQSVSQNIGAGFSELGVSPIPQKTVARLGGLGFIGKNNLMITDAYGCAVTICSVLTNAPINAVRYEPVSGECGRCTACRDACPTGALEGKRWTEKGGRARLLDVTKCGCPLKCMLACPYTKRYAGV